jgi:hypothetical protein
VESAGVEGGGGAIVGGTGPDTSDVEVMDEDDHDADDDESVDMFSLLEDGEEEEAVKRIWGSWEHVHPASAGATSQSGVFMVSGYSSTRDHPGSYAIHDPGKYAFSFDIGRDMKKTQTLPTGSTELQALGMKTLTSLPGSGAGSNGLDGFHIDPKSRWIIVDSIGDLAVVPLNKAKGKIILLTQKDTLELLELKDVVLQTRQSRSHRFQVPDKEGPPPPLSLFLLASDLFYDL